MVVYTVIINQPIFTFNTFRIDSSISDYCVTPHLTVEAAFALHVFDRIAKFHQVVPPQWFVANPRFLAGVNWRIIWIWNVATFDVNVWVPAVEFLVLSSRPLIFVVTSGLQTFIADYGE